MDALKYHFLATEGLNIHYTAPKLKYMTSDGKEFDLECEAILHESITSRERYYQYLLKKRNWFQKFFNMEPDMSFYDSRR